ncbi:uncharacterized protein LOC26528400 [Drosophila mojavensis]|uniref:Uncharacterized protein n=1 Tax=Drosophila mojavensis TaxID=7230 RepID=A0A0Q9X0F4_DROMO|nr:uncharacterized protein LOC26528400 [Drosophila mojavensis]KRG01033.1 uncharacterized protein Dmoj_GI26759 [Drosophila mojavensis]
MSTYRCSQLLLLCVLLGICAMSYAQVSGCAKNGQYCQMHRQCCSGRCMTYTYKCAPRVPHILYNNKDSPTGLDYLPEFHRNSVQNDLVTLNDIYKIQSTEKVGNAHDSSNPPSSDSCLSVGQPCSESRQCCRKRCHTYLHKCVT